MQGSSGRKLLTATKILNRNSHKAYLVELIKREVDGDQLIGGSRYKSFLINCGQIVVVCDQMRQSHAIEQVAG